MALQAIPNAVAKATGKQGTITGEDILEQTDISSINLRRPVDRGYIVLWDLQKDIWSSGFRKLLQGRRPENLGILLSEPYMNLVSMRERAMEMLLEDMKFTSVVMMYPSTLAMYHLAKNAKEVARNVAMDAGIGVIIDAGFSYTHIVPTFDFRPIKRAIRRIDIGGKALTNYMKELVSYRSMNMMKETYLMEHIKENLCFVSQNVEEDLKKSKSKKSPFRTEWFLPDGVTSTWGHVRDPTLPRDPKDPILVLNNERFMVPEAFLHPSDIGMEEAGVAEAIVESVEASHPHLHGLLYSNIVVIGGMARCQGLQERLFSELRPLIPDDYDLQVQIPSEPHLVAYKGASLVGASTEFRTLAVNLEEWKQYGVSACGKWDT